MALRGGPRAWNGRPGDQGLDGPSFRFPWKRVARAGPLSVTLATVATGMGGCALSGAPSYSLFGAFFPAWLLCSALGLATAFLFRGVVIATDLEEAMPLRLLTYTAFGATVAFWTWLTLFRNG